MEERVQIILEKDAFRINHTCGPIDAMGVISVVRQALIGPQPACVESLVITEFEPQKKICIAFNPELHRYQIAVSGMKINEAVGICEMSLGYLANFVLNGGKDEPVS
jgi:hypothetical protein